MRGLSFNQFIVVLQAREIKRVAPLERMSYLAYGIVIGGLAVECAVIVSTDFKFAAGDFLTAFFALIWLAFSGLVARKYAFRRVADILEGLALLFIAGALTSTATVLLSRVVGPFADAFLVAADGAMGFDWMKLLDIYMRHDWLFAASSYAYRSMFLQASLIPFALFLTGRRVRGWEFVTAWVVSGLLTALIFPFFPAEGPFVFHGLTPADVPALHVSFPWETGPAIDDIRNGLENDLAHAKSGLVSFPSFHTAAGILFAWAMWPVKPLKLIFLGLNGLMIFATLIRGAHYLIDLIGGGIVAGVAIVIATAFVRQNSQATD